MKKLFTILLLLTTVTLSAQYTGMYNGKVGMYNGKRGMIHTSNIPTSPENPSEPEDWEDSVSFTTLYFEDWQDFPVTNTATATSPVGIPEDTIEEYFTNFTMLGSDDANDPDKADNIDIIPYGDYKVLCSYYPEGMCCTGATADINANGTNDNTGTGVDLRGTITDPVSYISTLIGHYLIYFPKSTDWCGEYENAKGFKFPGVSTEESHGSIARLMILNYSSGTTLDPAYYTYAYYNDWTTQNGPVANTKTQTPDTWFTPGWHLVSVAYLSGTQLGDNGQMHLYIDGELIEDNTGGGGTLTSIPFLNSGTPTGFAYFKFSIFAGGETPVYNSPKDQFLLFGPAALETQSNYDTTPVSGQSIYVPKYMKDWWDALKNED